jgi:hypothetical protein
VQNQWHCCTKLLTWGSSGSVEGKGGHALREETSGTLERKGGDVLREISVLFISKLLISLQFPHL